MKLTVWCLMNYIFFGEKNLHFLYKNYSHVHSLKHTQNLVFLSIEIIVGSYNA